MATTPRNQGQPWHSGDEKLLVEWFNRGDPIAEIAAWFGRSVTAIQCRLSAMGYGEESIHVSKAPNRYLILGIRPDGHVRRFTGTRGYTPEKAIEQALLTDDLYAKNPKSGHHTLILISIKDASDDVGAPLNTDVQVIEREKPVPPYRVVSLNRQTK